MAVSVALAGYSAGATLSVYKDGSGDFIAIQPALDAAADGDTVLIGPGEFLEETVYRPSGWGFDIRAYCRVLSNNLTIIGSGVGETVIGPSSYANDPVFFNPKGIVYVGEGALFVQDLTVKNCREGIWMRGKLFLDRYEAIDCYAGISWETVGNGGWIKKSTIQGVVQPGVYPISVEILGPGSGAIIEDCNFYNSQLVVKNIIDCSLLRCDIDDTIVGLSIYDESSVSLDMCNLTNVSIVGVVFENSGGSCVVQNSTVVGGRRALETTDGCEFIVSYSTLIGGDTAVIYARQNPSPLKINNCDLIKGSGPAILCEGTNVPVSHDLTNNYWGTSDQALIEQWIVDINDDPSVLATVLFNPFSHESVPVEAGSQSMGSLKAMFR